MGLPVERTGPGGDFVKPLNRYCWQWTYSVQSNSSSVGSKPHSPNGAGRRHLLRKICHPSRPGHLLLPESEAGLSVENGPYLVCYGRFTVWCTSSARDRRNRN